MKASIIVQNIKCAGCAKTISTKLNELKNVTDVSVDQEISAVHFTYSKTDEALEIMEILESLGYPSIENKNSLKTKARSYFSCAVGKISRK